MNKNTVSVLGEEYTIHLLNPEDDAALNRCQGYTDESTHEIVVQLDLRDQRPGQRLGLGRYPQADHPARDRPRLFL